MTVLGIVAEYDPFHNGHLHHFRQAVSAVRPDAVIAALSGPFKQRGEASLFSPFCRAACAASAGADAVVALPVSWTVRDAEHYALGAVRVLSALGATHLAFGAETADLSLLDRTAALLESPPSAFHETLHAFLADGDGYPAALSRAVGSFSPECGSLLLRPNNILAVCYLRAVRRLGISLVPVVIPRAGSYHSEEIFPEYPSASALRNAFRRGDWSRALNALPDFSEKAARAAFLAGHVPDQRKLDALLLSALRSMTPLQAADLPDCSEGLERLLLRAAATASSREELIAQVSGRRYSAARISRLCACALLGLTRAQLEQEQLPDRALLLALKKNPSLTGSWKNAPVRVLTARAWFQNASPAEYSAWQVWALACGLPASYPFTQEVITVS